MSEKRPMPSDANPAPPPILVVEDDREQREALCAMLDLEGFAHADAANGREALDYLDRSGAPCLVLLDLEMPVMNGWDFREKQLEDESLSDIPVVVVTASDRASSQLFPGAAGFLWKPLNFEKVVAVLDRMCVRKKDVAPAPRPSTA
jgi:CheY-like chemotaxis protein